MQEKMVQGGSTKKTNGPVHEAETLTAKDVGIVPTTVAPMGGPVRKPKAISRDELLRLFKQYDAVDIKYQEAAKALLDAKVARSKVVEEIYFGSPEKKSFKMKDKGDAIWTIMTREDKKEGSPTLGQRFYFFRRPSTFDPLEI